MSILGRLITCMAFFIQNMVQPAQAQSISGCKLFARDPLLSQPSRMNGPKSFYVLYCQMRLRMASLAYLGVDALYMGARIRAFQSLRRSSSSSPVHVFDILLRRTRIRMRRIRTARVITGVQAMVARRKGALVPLFPGNNMSLALSLAVFIHDAIVIRSFAARFAAQPWPTAIHTVSAMLAYLYSWPQSRSNWCLWASKLAFWPLPGFTEQQRLDCGIRDTISTGQIPNSHAILKQNTNFFRQWITQFNGWHIFFFAKGLNSIDSTMGVGVCL